MNRIVMRWQTGLAIPLNVLTQAGKLAEMKKHDFVESVHYWTAIRSNQNTIVRAERPKQYFSVHRHTGFLRAVFAALSKQRPDGLYVSAGGPLMRANRKRIAGFALKSRLPSMYQSREGVDAGGLMYYGADLVDSYRRVATYVDKIMKGAKPADLAGCHSHEIAAIDRFEQRLYKRKEAALLLDKVDENLRIERNRARLEVIDQSHSRRSLFTCLPASTFFQTSFPSPWSSKMERGVAFSVATLRI